MVMMMTMMIERVLPPPATAHLLLRPTQWGREGWHVCVRAHAESRETLHHARHAHTVLRPARAVPFVRWGRLLLLLLHACTLLVL